MLELGHRGVRYQRVAKYLGAVSPQDGEARSVPTVILVGPVERDLATEGVGNDGFRVGHVDDRQCVTKSRHRVVQVD